MMPRVDAAFDHERKKLVRSRDDSSNLQMTVTATISSRQVIVKPYCSYVAAHYRQAKEASSASGASEYTVPSMTSRRQLTWFY